MKKLTTPLSYLAIAGTLLVGNISATYAENTAVTENPMTQQDNQARPPKSSIDLSNTEKLQQDGITVAYSKGFKQLAEENLQRLIKMAKFYEKSLNMKDITFTVALLNEADYPEHAKPIYGMPFAVIEQKTVVIPATDDGVIVKATLPQLNNVPKKALALFEKGGLTPEEAVKIFPLLLGYHEVGHLLTEENDMTNLTNGLNEFFATYFAVAFLTQDEPKLAAIYEGNAYISPYTTGEKPQYTSLQSFADGLVNPDTSVQNYDWFQKEFMKIAFAIDAKMGVDFISQFKEKIGNKPLIVDKEIDIIKAITPEFDVLIEKNEP